MRIELLTICVTHCLLVWFSHVTCLCTARPRADDFFVFLPADLQMVNITLRVLSKPSVEQLPEIFKVLPRPHISFLYNSHSHTCF